MERYLYLFGILMLIMLGVLSCGDKPKGDEPSQLMLVPMPVEIVPLGGTFTPEKEIELAVVKGGTPASEVTKTFAEDLSVINFHASVKTRWRAPKGSIALSIKSDKSLGEEGYRMTINGNRMVITANTDTGLFWGTRTALQLLASGPSISIPNLKITDKPQYAYRSLLLDPARSFHDIGFLLDTIKNLSAYKMNFLQIHFSDNDGYRLPSEKFPNLPSKGGNGERLHYSKEEIAKLTALAKKYHVTILPEIDMPGHATAISTALPQVRCSTAQGAAREMCIGSEESIETMKSIIDEAMEMFPGKYWHLGGDEASPELWKTCTVCQKYIAENDLRNTASLYNDFINRMNKFIKSKNRRMMVWEGFRRNTKPTIDKDVIVFPFDINLRKSARPMDYLDEGYTVVNASWKPLYVVWHMHVAEPEALAGWDACQFKSYHDDGKTGIYPMTEPWVVKPTSLIIGAQMCSWENNQEVLPGWLFGIGPFVPNQNNIQPASRVQIFAERLWTGTKTTPEDLLRRVKVNKKLLD